MIVKFCKKKVNNGRVYGDFVDGKLYVVLGIYHQENIDISVSILDGCGTPIGVPLKFFEVVDERILGEWEFSKELDVYWLSLLNLKGKVYSFIEDLLDGEPDVRQEAEERLQNEIRKQKELHGIE